MGTRPVLRAPSSYAREQEGEDEEKRGHGWESGEDPAVVLGEQVPGGTCTCPCIVGLWLDAAIHWPLSFSTAGTQPESFKNGGAWTNGGES